jgi:hypothetical protein
MKIMVLDRKVDDALSNTQCYPAYYTVSLEYSVMNAMTVILLDALS